jgi:hypothetical protein
MRQDMPDREEQVALLRRFREGDEAAFRILFEGHAGALSERIRRGLPAPLRRRLAVSDVLQEAHLAAFQHRERAQKTDSDFSSLRGTPDFEALFADAAADPRKPVEAGK